MSLAYRWPRKMESVLIDFISTQSNFWDVKNRDYYNRNKRRQVLMNAKQVLASKGFPADVHAISKKFKNLRTIFIKEYKKVKNSQISDPDSVYEPVWEHYKSLRFLRDAETSNHLRTHQEVSNDLPLLMDEDTSDIVEKTSNKLDEDKNDGLMKASLETNGNIDQLCETKPPITIQPSITIEPKNFESKSRKRKCPFELDYSPKLQEQSYNEQVHRSHSYSQDDDAAAFGTLIAHKLRLLRTANQMKAQADIIAILQKYVLGELEES